MPQESIKIAEMINVSVGYKESTYGFTVPCTQVPSFSAIEKVRPWVIVDRRHEADVFTGVTLVFGLDHEVISRSISESYRGRVPFNLMLI